MSLRAFLPRLALDYLARHPDRPVGVPERMRGTCLFADVSGFTALSESLAGMGREGSEILTRVLNEFYSEVIAVLEPAGGDVMRFAGDAVTVFFPGIEREGNALASASALQAMMAKFERVPTPAGESGLRMKIGLACGECLFFLVGSGEGLDYVFAGKSVDLCAEAEHLASAGDIVMADAGGGRQTAGGGREPVRDGFYRIVDVPSSPVPGLQPSAFSLQPRPEAEDALAGPFLHPRILELYRTGSLGLANEHRQAVVLFVQTGQTMDYALPEDLASLTAFYAEAQVLCRRYEGHINKIDCGDKGNKLLVVFGAPMAHEDDPDRALEFALALQKRSRETGRVLRIGINRARVFCGLVGSPGRHEYTVMGDGVNVAARLMQAAHEGACLASEELKKSASSAYYFQDLPPMQFKGKSRPLPVAKLQGRLGEKFEVPFFIGRERELALLREALQDHPEDRAFLAWVEGEPGIGKSYFLHYFADCSLPPDGRYHSRCQSYAASIAYYPVQKFLADILKDLETGGTVAPREKILEVLARRDPGIGEYAPLLFRLLNLSAPGDEEPDLEPEIRRSVLWKMMLLLLEEAVDRREVGWIIDNAQWMDEESRAFLIHLLRMLESRRLRIFAASREAAPEEPGLDVHRIPIEPFAPQEAAAFACAVLGVRDVPEEALKKAWAVGKGNPLLQLESLKLMLKSGYLSRSEDLPDILMVDPSLETEMPESLAGIVLSQVDALPADEKAALSRLSVVGENIPEILVRALGMDPLVLDRLTASGQFLRYNPASRNFFFAKQAYQQALYESLEFAFRRETHRRIGEAIPQVFDSSRPDYAFLLAGHFGEAEDARAIPFLQRIGREARASYALEEAARAFSRLVRISEKTGGDLQAALVELADLWLLLGNAGEAVKLLEGHFSAFGPEWTSAAHRTLAGALRAQGAFGLAEARGKKALAASANPRDSFLAECFLGKLYGQTGRMEPALRLLEGIDRTHRRFRDDPEYQMNRMRLAFIHFQTGKASRAVKTFQSLNTWFRQHRQIKGQYIILNNMSKLALEQGNYAKAIRYCREAYAIVHKFGVWESETTLSILQNLGVTYLDLGDFKNARKHLSTGLAYARRISSPLEYKALYSLAFVSFDLGNLKECLDLLNNALQACTAAEIPRHEVLELFLDLYLVLAHRPGFEEALRSYRAEVERMNLLYLKASLLNYRAEGAWMFEGSTGLMEPLKANMESCRREGDAVEAYRAARSLFCMTRDPRYLSDLAALSGRFQRRRNRVGFLLLSYQADPTGRNRSRLLAQLRRYPYGVYRLEASVVSAQNAATPRRAALHRREVRRLLEDLARGLPEDLQASFRSRADIRSVLEEASPVPADASSPARK